METNLLGHPGTMCCFIGDRHPAPSISASTHGQRNELSKNGGPRPKPCPLEPQGRCESSWHLLSSKSYKWCKNAHGVDLVVGPEVPINVCESRPFQFGLLGKSCTTWKKLFHWISSMFKQWTVPNFASIWSITAAFLDHSDRKSVV